ncbi:hypothetical protein EPN18_06795 [bacterium]|nr:MAG: hypothetical protein EPN18_06795 [bacterium]
MNFTTTTGLGYIKDDVTGRIVSKCDFPAKVNIMTGKPIPTTHLIKDGYSFVEVVSRAELDAITLQTIDELKNELIGFVKAEASSRILLHAPDYKVLRHKEQIDAGLQTTLTSVDYSALLAVRQAIRSASKVIETEIMGISDIMGLQTFNITSNKAWPI